MNADYDQIYAEITRIAELTHEYKLLWEKIPNKNLRYRTCSAGYPQVVVSCDSGECWIEINGTRLTVPCEDLLSLCGEIVRQIRNRKLQVSKTVNLLRTIRPQQEAG